MSGLTQKFVCVVANVVGIIALFTGCAAQQPVLQSTEDALRYVPELEMSVTYPDVRAFTADGTCVHVLHNWHVVTTEPEMILERPDIGRITVITVGNSRQMMLDLWTEQTDTEDDDSGDQMAPPDCENSYGCQTTYVRDDSRVHTYQAGGSHVVELTYPVDSRNGEFAIADAIRTAQEVGCPTAE